LPAGGGLPLVERLPREFERRIQAADPAALRDRGVPPDLHSRSRPQRDRDQRRRVGLIYRGRERPSFSICASIASISFTLSGYCAARLFCSAMSLARLNSCGCGSLPISLPV